MDRLPITFMAIALAIQLPNPAGAQVAGMIPLVTAIPVMAQGGGQSDGGPRQLTTGARIYELVKGLAKLTLVAVVILLVIRNVLQPSRKGGRGDEPGGQNQNDKSD